MITALLSVGCSTKPPPDVTVVSDFQLPRYLGNWYEIARLNHPFEQGLDHVTAHYSMREDGGVKVVNRGFNTEKTNGRRASAKLISFSRRILLRSKCLSSAHSMVVTT